jgi:hypothetical protein
MTDLAKLEAFLAITELKGRYCYTLDSKDWDGFAGCFTEDLVLDVTGSGGGVTHGRDEAIKSVRASIEHAATSHQVHTPLITLNGDTADVIWAMQDRVVWGANPVNGVKALTGYGHYREHCVRKDGRWRIARQALTRLHMDFELA